MLPRLGWLAVWLPMIGSAVAQQPPPPGPARGAQQRIDFECGGIDLRDFMEAVGRQAGQTIVVDPGVKESVTVTLRDIPWREAVDVIARMTRCEVEELPGGVLLLHQPPRVTIQMTEGANIRTVLQLLAAYAGQNVVMAPGVTGSIDVDLKEERWQSALETICAAAKLHVERRGEVWVVSDQPLPPLPPAPAPAGPPAPAVDDGRKVDLDVEALDLQDACERVGRDAGRNILVDPAVRETVTVALRAVPWRAAVQVLARLTRCRVEERPGGVLVLTQPPKNTLQAQGAPAATWFRLLAAQAGLSITLGELRGTIDCDLKQLHPLEALQALADALQVGVERRGDTLVLVPPAGGVADPAPAPSPVDALLKDIDALARAGDAAGLEPRLRDLLATVKAGRASRAPRPAPGPPSPESAAEVDALLEKITTLAEERKVEELIEAFTGLRELMGRDGAAGIRAVRERMAAWGKRLEGLGEVTLSLRLQVAQAEGNQHLRAMAEALREDDFEAVHRSMRELTALVESMREQEREAFHRNADALLLRGKALADRARRLERCAAVPLRVTGIVVVDPASGGKDQAIVNGWLVSEGDAPRDAAGEELAGYRVVEVARGAVRLRFEDAEFVRELGRR